MNAYHLLTVLKDARDEGLWREQAAVVGQLEIDAEYVRVRASHRPCRTIARALHPTRSRLDKRLVRMRTWLIGQPDWPGTRP